MLDKRFTLAGTLFLAIALGNIAQAQEVYRASWKIQDRARGLEQQFARDIIERANDWLTHEDPEAQTARLDDPVRVTVVGEVGAGGGAIRRRLGRLVLGTIAIDTGFNEFLDPGTIASLVRRDHYWSDESIVVYNQALSPIPSSSDDFQVDSIDMIFERAFEPQRKPHVTLALNESSVTFSPGLRVWGGLGFEEIALPDFSFGRARIGVAYNRLRIWAELPAPFGGRDNPFLARGLEGTYGLGLSFEEDWFGGAISAGNDPEGRASGSESYYLSKAALAYGIVPIRLALLGDLPLRAKVGLGFTQATPVMKNEDGTAALDAIESPKAFVRFEFASPSEDGSQLRSGSLEMFGWSILATYQQRITSLFGVRLAATVHGIDGDPDPFLPRYSITISPIFTIW